MMDTTGILKPKVSVALVLWWVVQLMLCPVQVQVSGATDLTICPHEDVEAGWPGKHRGGDQDNGSGRIGLALPCLFMTGSQFATGLGVCPLKYK